MMLSIHQLSKNYQDQVIFKEIDLTAAGGDFIILNGQNGSGKTTLLNIISSLELFDSGKIELLGLCSKRKYWEYKSKLRYNMDSAYLYNSLTGMEYLQMTMNFWEVRDRKLLDELIEVFGMNYLDGFIANYSLGMKQKLSLAACLVTSPSLLLLDEPMTGIDQESRPMITAYLHQYITNGERIAIATTHFQELASSLGNRFYRITDRTLVAEKVLYDTAIPM